MRPVALGRRNWMHIGSPQAGPKVAAIFSVVETCRRLRLPVRDYLAAALPGLADRPIQRLLRPYYHSVGRPAFIDSSDRSVSAKVIFATLWPAS